jgi:hypothetical protein
MKTKTYNVYKFDELSKEAQEKALINLIDINTDHDWWQFTYEDAAEIGLKLDGFDLDRNRHATGKFTNDAEYCQYRIVQEHGAVCETYKAAQKFTAARAQLDINSDEYDDQLEVLEDTFLKELLDVYSVILQKEYEYLSSDESIKGTIAVNDYDFTENGEID